jgi:tetratricopeptide (TPR) repeat protein
MKFFHKGLQLARFCGDTNQQCTALISIAFLNFQVGDCCLSQMHASEAQQLAKLSANLYDEARALQVTAMCSRHLGNYQESMRQLHRAREILRICGMSGGSTDHDIRTSQAEVHLLKSEYAEARSINIQIIETTSDENPQTHAFALVNVAEIDEKIGRATEEVYRNLDKADVIFSKFNRQSGIIFCEFFRAMLQLRDEKFQLAIVKFQQCLHSAQGRSNQVQSLCLEALANIKAWQAIGPQSTWPVVYLGYAHKTKAKLALHKALLFLGDVFISDQDDNTAYSLYVLALEGFTYMDVHCSRAQCMLRLGDLAGKRGDFSHATEYWSTARPLFERSLQKKDIAEIDKRLAAMEETQQKTLTQLTALHVPTTLPQMLPNSDNSKILELKERASKDLQS